MRLTPRYPCQDPSETSGEPNPIPNRSSRKLYEAKQKLHRSLYALKDYSLTPTVHVQ